jgi:hypothetical protein
MLCTILLSCVALGAAADPKAEEVQFLADRNGKLLLGDDPNQVEKAAVKLKELGEPGRKYLLQGAVKYAEKINKISQDKQPGVTVSAYLKILLCLPTKDVGEDHVKHLRTCLDFTKNDPIRLLGALGTKAKAALPELKKIKDDPQTPEDVALQALKAIRSIEGK